MRNKEIREALKKSGVRYWELADRLGMSQCWFSVKLRKEFTSEEKEKMLSVIQEIAEEKQKERKVAI